MASPDLLSTPGPFERRRLPRRTGPADPKHRLGFLKGLRAVEAAGIQRRGPQPKSCCHHRGGRRSGRLAVRAAVDV